MNRREFVYVLSGALTSTLFAFLTGCAKKPTQYYLNPYVAKNIAAPEIVHCFTTIGHKKGTFPFILGGTCVCTPTQELVEVYHADGFLADYDLRRLIAEYERRDIVLEHENGWQCNNQCKQGPHIVFGGKCMVSPTIATQNFENVATGKVPKA
jgi:hypothetical protein